MSAATEASSPVSAPAGGPLDAPSKDPEPPAPEQRSGIRSKSPILDVTAVAALTLCGVYGFTNAYGGWRYLLAGGVGVALGTAAAWIGASRRQSLLVVAAVTLVGFVLFGGAVAVPDRALFGVVPTPGSVADLFDGAIAGWKRLLTTEPPAGGGSNLLVVPYLCGTVCTVVASTIALRSRHPQFAVFPPLALLALSILFGTFEPASIVVQGSLFAGLMIWWLAEAQRRARIVATTGRRSRRWIGALAMVAVAAAIGTMLGPSVPGADSNPRFVLRDVTEPPFTPADYPSPLNGYRNFTDGAPLTAGDSADPATSATAPTAGSGWNRTELFEVTGLPEDQRLRLATLDTYDGIVYQVGSGTNSSGYFRKISESVPPAPGIELGDERHEVSVEVLDVDGGRGPYDDIWVPLPEGVQTIRFSGGDAEVLAESLRYNTATGTAAIAERITAGDRYEMDVASPVRPSPDDLEKAEPGPSTPTPYQVAGLSDAAREFAGEVDCRAPDAAPDAGDPDASDDSSPATRRAQSPYGRATEIAKNLIRCGGLSDGEDSILPGHSSGRLEQMIAPGSGVMIGNGEQYAPLAALMSQQLGVPARVVMGFRSKQESDEWRTDPSRELEANGDTYRVIGADITAWVEVSLDGHGWVPIDDVTPTQEQPLIRPAPKPLSPTNEPPPPPPSLPNAEEELADASRVRPPVVEEEDDDESSAFPWWIVKWVVFALSPLIVLGLITALIAGAKSRRRTRRRTRGSPDARVDGGWAEIADLARDIGSPLPGRSTRREAAALSTHQQLKPLAASTDMIVFGPEDMTEAQVERYWNAVDATRADMLSGLSQFDRWRALVNLSSFRSSIDRRLAARSTARRRQAMSTTAARTAQVRSTVGAGR